MKKLDSIRVHDDFIQSLQAFFLRPWLFVEMSNGMLDPNSMPAARAHFLATLSSMDIVFKSDLVKDFINFPRPPSIRNIKDLIAHFVSFYESNIIVSGNRNFKAEPDHKVDLDPIPIRQDIEILPPDKATKFKLNWIVREYIGTPVLHWFPDGPDPFRLKKREDIKIGDKTCFSWKDTGWSYEVTSQIDESSFWAKNKQDHGVLLHFDTDDRHCWTSGCFVNLRGISKGSKEVKVG